MMALALQQAMHQHYMFYAARLSSKLPVYKYNYSMKMAVQMLCEECYKELVRRTFKAYMSIELCKLCTPVALPSTWRKKKTCLI